MPTNDLIAEPWPDPESLGHVRKLIARLEKLPDEISGVSLKVLKDTTLPAWKDGDPQALLDIIDGANLVCGNAGQLLAKLQSLPLPDSSQLLSETELAASILAARVMRRHGSHDRAVHMLWAVSRAVRLRPAGTFFALWLLDVADKWLKDLKCDKVRCKVWADLGALVAQAGDRSEGLRLLRNAAEQMFAAAGKEQQGDGLEAAWQFKYAAAEWGLRTRGLPLVQAIAELMAICHRLGAPVGGETWFHAGFELLAAEAGPTSWAAGVATAEQLLRQVETADLLAAAKNRLKGHGHRVLGHVLRFGNNRFLHTRSRDEFEAAVAIFRANRNWSNLAQALDALGRICSQLGDHPSAHAAFQESLELKQNLKDDLGLGASFNGLASSLQRQGRSLDAVALYEANIAILSQMPGTSTGLILQNLGEQAAAHMAAYLGALGSEDWKPEERDLTNAAKTLQKYASLMVGQPHMEISNAYHLMLQGTLARLRARLVSDTGDRLKLLGEAERQIADSIKEFHDAPPSARNVAVGTAEIQLGGVLTDQARLVKDTSAREQLLASANVALESAEKHIWDSYERAYLELEWASFWQAMNEPVQAANHIASARHLANTCGNESIQLHAQSFMGIHLRGPTDQDRWDVVLPPGQQLDIPVFARDWRDRPLAWYGLRASVTCPANARGVKVELSPTTSLTDALGRARFTVKSLEGTEHGTVVLEVRDHNVLRETQARIHVQPFDIHVDPDIADRVHLSTDDEIVIRHLFGPHFRRVVILKPFSGFGGSQVLLVEPHLALPAGLETDELSSERGLKAQYCLVKIGGRREVAAEVACYEKHVKDILSPNVSRIANWTVWGDRAGFRMSLAGDQDWDRALDEMDWLVKAPMMDTHHLLDEMFARDLGEWWYTNGSAPAAGMRVYEVYGRQLPALLTIREPSPAGGLLTDPPRGQPRTPITDGLRPPGRQRGVDKGDSVYLGQMQIGGWSQRGPGEWDYELYSAEDGGLRVHFRTQLPPQFVDQDGVTDKLVGQPRYIMGIIELIAHDHFSEVLQDCLTLQRWDLANENVSLAGGGATLKVVTEVGQHFVPNPLHYLHDFLYNPLPHRRSIIHGDLHIRNVIVSPSGRPYYIDFSEAHVGPTLFDFVKHEVSLWDWNLACRPDGNRQCSLSDGFRLMAELTNRDNRFPAPFAIPRSLQEKRDLKMMLAKFYQCVSTLRSLAKQHSAKPDEALDYFGPLCLYASLALRWCDPRTTDQANEKLKRARRGVFLTVLAGMLLKRGLAGLPVPAEEVGVPASAG